MFPVFAQSIVDTIDIAIGASLFDGYNFARGRNRTRRPPLSLTRAKLASYRVLLVIHAYVSPHDTTRHDKPLGIRLGLVVTPSMACYEVYCIVLMVRKNAAYVPTCQLNYVPKS